MSFERERERGGREREGARGRERERQTKHKEEIIRKQNEMSKVSFVRAEQVQKMDDERLTNRRGQRVEGVSDGKQLETRHGESRHEWVTQGQ